MITSKQNDNIRLVEKLLNYKKYRQQYRLYVVEGQKLLNEAVRFGKKIHSIYIAESSKAVVDKTLEQYVTVVSDSVYKMLDSTVNGQGVLAVLYFDGDESSVVDGINACNLAKLSGDSLILDGIQDPGNMGTILRSALACGFCNVYCSNCVDIYSPKVVRSAMSAHFALNLMSVTIEQAFSLTSGSIRICADMHGENISQFQRNEKQNITLILGNEGNGISEFSRLNSDKVLSLPMKNNLESLNVAVAGSIMMYLLQSKN